MDESFRNAQREYDNMEPVGNDMPQVLFDEWLDNNLKALEAHFRKNYLEQYELEREAWSLEDTKRFAEFCNAEYQKALDRDTVCSDWVAR